jgi:divalent metal cation (Fe/Co/Zn/Cd) transporter
MGARDGDVDPARGRLLGRALRLSYFSVAWGLVAGAWAITAGLLAGSLGVLGLGLNTIADVAGSIGLIWRFGVERNDPEKGIHAERRASIVVASALGLVAITLAVASINDLLSHSVPEHSLLAMSSAGASAIVLAPLGRAKYRTGRLLDSHALMGDGTLSGIGAALGVLALLGLLSEQLLGWWWADRATALCVAAVAAAEAIRVIRTRPD